MMLWPMRSFRICASTSSAFPVRKSLRKISDAREVAGMGTPARVHDRELLPLVLSMRDEKRVSRPM